MALFQGFGNPEKVSPRMDPSRTAVRTRGFVPANRVWLINTRHAALQYRVQATKGFLPGCPLFPVAYRWVRATPIGKLSPNGVPKLSPGKVKNGENGEHSRVSSALCLCLQALPCLQGTLCIAHLHFDTCRTDVQDGRSSPLFSPQG